MKNRWMLVDPLNLILILAVIVTVTAVGVTVTKYSHAQDRSQTNVDQTINQSKKDDDEATPVIDIDSPQPNSSVRIAKGRRYNKSRVVVTNINNSNVTEFMWNNPSGQILPDFPIVDSDLIVEGQVTDSAAYLSDDRGTVYSEFTVRISNIIKADPNLNIKLQDSITTERYGGRVKYPGGKTIRYGFGGIGSPAKGKTYLLFLAKTQSENYLIVTGYEFRGGKVFSLDGTHLLRNGQGNWNSDKHNNQDIQSFMEEFERAKINPPASYKNRSVGP